MCVCCKETYDTIGEEKMKIWLEVSSDYRFDKKLGGEIGLFAPATNRYKNMMYGIKQDDVILHYIIKQRAKKEHESRIIAISKTSSGIREESPRIVVDLKDISLLPIPVTLNEIKAMKRKSENLKKLIRMSFLRYLSEIDKIDLKNILKIHEENSQSLCSIKPYKDILGK
jgi:hypothetical protein